MQRTVGHEQILHVVRLIVFVQHAGLGIAAHARRAHFVNAETGPRNVLEHVDVSCAGGSEHFSGLNGDIAGHGVFVLAPVAVNLQRRNSPRVEFVLVHFDVIVVVRQAFAEAGKGHAPRAGLAQHVLEVHADAGHVGAARPAFAAAAALIAVAAQEILLLGFHVAETRNVNSIGTIAERHFVFVAGHDRRKRPRPCGDPSGYGRVRRCCWPGRWEIPAVAEFSRMRVDSSVARIQKNDAALEFQSASCVCPSITRTPVTLRVAGSKIRLCTTLYGRMVSLPVFIAAGSVEFRLLK